MFSLNGMAPCPTSSHSTHADRPKLTATPPMVAVCAPTRPTTLRNRPAMIAPSSGASTMASSTDFEIICSTPGIGSALQRVEVGDVDRAPVAEQGDQDREADRGLRGGDREDEEHEHLAGRIAQVARERHEVDVHREQHQLDRHQQDDDVLPVEEDARHADAEQRRAERQVVAEGQAGGDRDHALPSSVLLAVASTAGCSVGTDTMRTRSRARTDVCQAGSWCLAPTRRRRVSITAAMTAMVRMIAATS